MSSLLSPSTLVIDVRSPAEFASGHLEGATNLPLDRLAGLCAQALPDHQADIVVYCAAGGRSAMACRMLGELGYRRVRDGGALSVLALGCGRPLRRV